MIEKLEPAFPGLAEKIDELRKEVWRKAVQDGRTDDLKIVCGFWSIFEDDVVGKCSKCGRDVSVRGWLKKEAEKHSVPIICIHCAVELGIGIDSEITVL